jgi:ribonuclease HII
LENKVKKNKLQELVNFDLELWDRYKPDLLVGLDEVGRGSLAGPLYTSAFGLNSKKQLKSLLKCRELKVLDDSKKVSKKNRRSLCEALESPKISAGIGVSYTEASSIDSYGIIDSIWTSMKESLEDCLKNTSKFSIECVPNILVLIDGPKTIPDLNFDHCKIRQISIVKGDSKSAVIASASNLAKRARDEYMKELSSEYGFYFWESNVGYGTQKHREMILSHGPSPHHRISFLKKVLQN